MRCQGRQYPWPPSSRDVWPSMGSMHTWASFKLFPESFVHLNTDKRSRCILKITNCHAISETIINFAVFISSFKTPHRNWTLKK